MKNFYYLFIFFCISFNALGQSTIKKELVGLSKISQFSEITDAFPDVYLGSAAWGDYDKDGNIDLLLSGIDNSSNLYAEIYKNNGDSTFTNINAGFTGIERGVANWADYNNDNYLDAFIIGKNSDGTCISKLYSNDKDGTFSEISTGILGLYESDAAWADYNNDGWVDILVSGANQSNSAFTKLYMNNGDSAFSEVSVDFVNSLHADIAWFDYNNDGFIDIIITGHDTDSGSPSTKLYSNNGNGTFTIINTGIINVTYGDVQTADFNEDGYQDVVIAGSNSGRYAYIYKNNGDSTFIQQASGLTGVIHCAISTVDYDNDGDIDVYISGATNTITDAILYTNNGGFSFSSNSSVFTETAYSASAWGDYNNDTKPDHLLNGESDGGKITKLYGYNMLSNTAPEIPTHLSSNIECNSATLNWLSSIDTENSTKLNTYNFYIGTESGFGNVVSPNANSSTGARYINQKGNALYDTSITINNLAPGTYYWSVQTLDVNNLPSEFVAEESFTIDDLSIQITTQPDAPEVCLGVDTAVSVIATGNVDSYLWQYSKDGGSSWIDTSGTEPRFSLDHLSQEMNLYQFRCVVSSHCETLISNEVELIIHPEPEKPVITPDGYTLFANSGSGYDAYQWYNESGEINGAINNSYIPDADDTYYVNVLSVYGCSNISDGLYFNYLSEPQIISQPVNAELCESLDTAFTITATGDEITFQWQVSENEGVDFSNIEITSNRLELQNNAVADRGNLYRCIISNDYYEIISDTVELVVHENPSKPSITETEGVLSSTSATTYQWYNSSGLIDNATSISYTPSVNGDYAVVVTNEFGCENESDAYSFVINSMDNLSNELITIFPNPVKQHFTIKYQNKPHKITIYSNTGLLVFEEDIPAEYEHVIDVSRLNTGIYFISIKYMNKILTHKFVIE